MFDIFKKKSATAGADATQTARASTPVVIRPPVKRLPTDPLGPRVPGVAPAFQNEVPGRFSRGNGRGLGNTTISSEFGPASIADESGRRAPGMRGLIPSPSQLSTGPLTQAAFTQLPTELDMSGSPRRPMLNVKDLPEALENCVLSYANDQVGDALRQIERAIEQGALESWTMQAWLMRFDLYEFLGKREAFEEAAGRFSSLFDRSAPVWPGSVDAKRGKDIDMPSVNITGTLSASSSAPLSALRKTVDRYPGVQLDFARIAGVDREGCRYLLVMLQALKRAGKSVRFANEENLIRLVREHVKPGDKLADASPWLLMFELLQYQKRRDDFTRMALDYALTYDVAVPEWDESFVPPVNVPTAATGEQQNVFVIEGDVTAPADKLLGELREHGAKNQLLVLDLRKTRRIDFVSCSQLASVLAKIQQSGRSIEVRSPNGMVWGLLMLMGIADIARIVPRR